MLIAKNKNKIFSNKSLRKIGIIPAIIYSKNCNIPISFRVNDFLKESIKCKKKIIKVLVDKKIYNVFIKKNYVHPVSNNILHIDLQKIEDNRYIYIFVPILILNYWNSIGIKKGGTLNLIQKELPIKCKYSDIPKRIEIDISLLDLGHNIKVGDIKSNVMLNENDLLMNISGRMIEEKTNVASR